MATEAKKTIECDQHGPSAFGLVCRHLVQNNGHPLGFVENSDDPDDLQAWCYACEYFYQQQQDLTEEFEKFCDCAIVCTKCYADIKAKHSIASLFGMNA